MYVVLIFNSLYDTENIEYKVILLIIVLFGLFCCIINLSVVNMDDYLLIILLSIIISNLYLINEYLIALY